MQNNKTIVNFVDFIMNDDFSVKPASTGIGRFISDNNLMI